MRNWDRIEVGVSLSFVRTIIVIWEACICGNQEVGWCGDKPAGFESDLGSSPDLPFPGCVSLGAALNQIGVGFRIPCWDNSLDSPVESSSNCTWQPRFHSFYGLPSLWSHFPCSLTWAFQGHLPDKLLCPHPGLRLCFWEAQMKTLNLGCTPTLVGPWEVERDGVCACPAQLLTWQEFCKRASPFPSPVQPNVCFF